MWCFPAAELQLAASPGLASASQRGTDPFYAPSASVHSKVAKFTVLLELLQFNELRKSEMVFHNRLEWRLLWKQGAFDYKEVVWWGLLPCWGCAAGATETGSFCSSRLQREMLTFPFCWRFLAEVSDRCGAAGLALPISLQFPTVANRQEQPPLPAFREGRVTLELCSKQWKLHGSGLCFPSCSCPNSYPRWLLALPARGAAVWASVGHCSPGPLSWPPPACSLHHLDVCVAGWFVEFCFLLQLFYW